jgi:Bap31/Bap29 transmembrane region
VFALLVSEMVLFMGLIVPLPFSIKRKMFNFISESPIVAKLQYGMKITFIFILILFIDSVNRVYRVQVEMGALHKDTSGAGYVCSTDRRHGNLTMLTPLTDVLLQWAPSEWKFKPASSTRSETCTLPASRSSSP